MRQRIAHQHQEAKEPSEKKRQVLGNRRPWKEKRAERGTQRPKLVTEAL
jgi:hypothetical protein